MRSDFNVVNQQVSKGGQDVTFKLLATLRLMTTGDKQIVHKFRFEIKSDSYRQQCHAKVEVWSSADLRWNEVASLRGEEMATSNGLHHRPAGGLAGWDCLASFDKDLELLMKMAETVVC